MIRISFNGTDARVAAAMKAKGPKIVSSLQKELDLLMFDLLRRVQQKLSGEVLQHRSGVLLGSAHKETTVLSGGTITGKVTAAGGPAFYGRIQEKGGTRSYEILPRNKKALAFTPGGGEGRGMRFQLGARRGSLKPAQLGAFREGGGIVVRRVIHPPLPARPFMSTSLEEMRPTIISRLQLALGMAVRS